MNGNLHTLYYIEALKHSYTVNELTSIDSINIREYCNNDPKSVRYIIRISSRKACSLLKQSEPPKKEL